MLKVRTRLGMAAGRDLRERRVRWPGGGRGVRDDVWRVRARPGVGRLPMARSARTSGILEQYGARGSETGCGTWEPADADA